MGFSITGLVASLAILFIAGALIYYYCCRRKKSSGRGTQENNLISGDLGIPPAQEPVQPYSKPTSAPIGWNINQTSTAPGGAPYPTTGQGAAPYPTAGPISAPYPTVGPGYGSSGSTVPGSGLIETTPSAPPPPYSSPPPPYPN